MKGGAALSYAASIGCFQICKDLLAQPNIDININFKDENGFTALYWVTFYNHTDVCKLLLNHGAVVEYELIDVDANGNYEIVALILSRDCVDVNLEHENVNALSCAAGARHTEICKLLLSYGAKLPRNYDNTDYSPIIATILNNSRSYLPDWNRFKTCKYYPREFNVDIAFTWLLCCKRFIPKLPKDIWYLMIELNVCLYTMIFY